MVLPHIIGTSALLSMFLLVGTYYNGFYANLHGEAYRAQLGQVADYLASTTMDLVTLCRLTSNDVFLVKDVEAPPFIGEKIFKISFITMTPSYGDTDLIRIVAQIEALNIYTTSDLPWSTSAGIQVYSNQSITNPYGGSLNITNTILSDAAVGRSKITGAASMVVWCYKSGDVITIGLGVMDRS